MASKLLGYADTTKLANARVALLSAAVAAGRVNPLTDAAGHPLDNTNPIFRRNPTFATSDYAPVATFFGVAGGLLEADAFTETVLGASEVAARTVPTPTKPTNPQDEAAYKTALLAAVPTKEPSGAVKATAVKE